MTSVWFTHETKSLALGLSACMTQKRGNPEISRVLATRHGLPMGVGLRFSTVHRHCEAVNITEYKLRPTNESFSSKRMARQDSLGRPIRVSSRTWTPLLFLKELRLSSCVRCFDFECGAWMTVRRILSPTFTTATSCGSTGHDPRKNLHCPISRITGHLK